jgi:hypothetical protein
VNADVYSYSRPLHYVWYTVCPSERIRLALNLCFCYDMLFRWYLTLQIFVPGYSHFFVFLYRSCSQKYICLWFSFVMYYSGGTRLILQTGVWLFSFFL